MKPRRQPSELYSKQTGTSRECYLLPSFSKFCRTTTSICQPKTRASPFTTFRTTITVTLNTQTHSGTSKQPQIALFGSRPMFKTRRRPSGSPEGQKTVTYKLPQAISRHLFTAVLSARCTTPRQLPAPMWLRRLPTLIQFNKK